MTNHDWDKTLIIDASLGFTQPARPYKIFAPDATAAAITGMVCSMSVEHGPGRKVRLGPLWLRRARQRAEDVQRQLDDM